MNIEKLFFYCIYFYLFATNYVVLTVRILAVFPSLSYSHYIVGEVLLEKLAECGHQITLVSPFKMKKPNANINEIRLDGMKKYLEENGVKFNYLNYADKYVIEYLTDRIYVTGETVNFTLGHPKMQELLNSDIQFDILITDLYLTDALLGLAYYYKIPSIVLSTTGMNKWVNEMTGNPDNPAYIPNLSLSFIDKMNLKERILNSLMAIFNEITYKFMYLPVQESLYKRYFAGLHTDELPPLIDLIHNVSLVLVNTHPALQYPQPFVRNAVEVGGLHIKEPKELPPDIAEFIDNAIDGVIYVNLGGSIRAADMPKDKRDAFVKTFAKLNKMRMIIKWENVTLDGQTNNVVIGPWLPQIEILSHPNVKLFITHGGILSNMEALYAGKPVIGIPIYGDQYGNVARIEDHGYGIKLDYNNITEITLMEAIQEILNNEKYQRNAIKFSQLFKRNMVQPLDKALYYIDDIINNKENINYLRSSAIYLNLTQTLLLDVLLIIITMIVTIIAVPSIIICIVLRCNNSNNNLINNNNNITMKNNNNNNNINLLKQNINVNKKLYNQKIDVNRNKKKQ